MRILSFGLILVVFSAVFLTLSRDRLMMDERLHMRQIVRFSRGDFALSTELSMGPGYHLLMAPFALLFGPDRALLRTLQLGISVLFLVVFYHAAKKTDPKDAHVKLLQAAFFPVFFPYYFLLYSDIFTLLLLTAAYLLVLRRRYPLAGILASASVTVRQTSVIWIGYLLVIACLQERTLGKSIQKFTTFFIGIAGFVLFVFVNGGVAVGAREYQPLALSPNNILLVLFLLFLFFLPEHAAGARQLGQFFKKHAVFFLPTILIGAIVIVYGFQNAHPWNQTPYFLRNRLLIWFSMHPFHTLIFFLAAFFQMVSLAQQRFVQKYGAIVYIFGAVSLGLLSLVEPRYALPFLLFFLLTRSVPSAGASYFTIPVFLFFSLFQIWGLHMDRFFP